MSETTKLRGFIRNAMTESLCNHNDLLAVRTYRRDQLLQNISTDIQTIILESNTSIELAIDEWVSSSECMTSDRIQLRKRMAQDALKRFPIND
jgi:hypothetical protein